MPKALKLLPHQYKLIKDTNTKILGMVAGFGSGKSYAVARKAVMLSMANAGCDSIVCEPTHPLLVQILIPEMKNALAFFGVKYEYKSGEGIFYCIIKGLETRIICKSMENYDRLIGINASHVILDEFDVTKKELAMNAYIKLLGRIRVGTVRQMVIVSTPEGYNAMYQIFIEEADESKRLIKAKTTDNYHLPQDYIDTMRSQYPPELIDAYLNGEFTNLTSGTVYTQFDRTMNDTSMEDDMMSDLHIGIDFNVSAMSAIVHLVKDQHSFAIAEHIDLFDTPELIQVLGETYRGRKIICYPDAAGNARKTVQASQSDINLLKQAGFTVRANTKNPSIMDRVNGLNSMYCNSLGERKAFVNTNKCPKLTKALEQQSYDENTNMPDKKNGHDNKGLDATGYFHAFMFPVRAVIRSKYDRPPIQPKKDWSPFGD